MTKVTKNFQKEDCKHFAWVMAKACCGRSYKAGVCTIADETGNKTHKTCLTSMPYCHYEKEETNVYPTELPDSDGGNS